VRTVTDFLAVFYTDLDEPIHLRAIRPKGAAETPENKTVNLKTSRRKLATDKRLHRYLIRLNKTRGLYFVVNAGGTKKKDITRFNAFFAEGDQLSIPEQYALLDSLPCPPSIRVETLKSVHAYWPNQVGCSAAEWQEVQRRLARHLQSDASLDDLPQLMRLPYFNHVSLSEDGELSYKPVGVVQFEPERRYTAQQLLDAFPPVPSDPIHQIKADRQNSSGFATWDALWAEWGRRLMAHPSAHQNSASNWDCRGICHEGKSESALVYFPARNRGYCNAKCDEATVLRAFGLPEQPDSDGATRNGKLGTAEPEQEFDHRAKAITEADSAERDDLIRQLVNDLVVSADALTLDNVGKLLKDAKVLSLATWRQLVKDERERQRQLRNGDALEREKAERAARVQELLDTKSDLLTIHQTLSETTSSPHSHDVIELALATAISHQLVGEKLLWLLIVGPPSSDKTQTAIAIKDAPHVFHLDTLTENSFISGFVSPDGRAAQDLLGELDGRCLTIKDLNALFSLHPDKVAKVLGDLTAIYDEEFAKWTGTRGEVRYAARFSFIGCVTPLTLAHHHRYMSMIGARFLSYRVAELDAEAVESGFDTIWASKGESRNRLRELASAYAAQLHHQLSEGMRLPTFSYSAMQTLNGLARFLAHGRAAVRTQRADITTDSGRTMTVYDIVEVQREEPFRALLQLRVLAMALAIVHQRSEVTKHELELCRRVVLSSMPYDRSLILGLFQKPSHLTQNYGLTRKAAAEGIGKARNQAVRLLTELEAIDILRGEKTHDDEQNVDLWTYYPATQEFAGILTKATLSLDHSGDLGKILLPADVVLCQATLTQNYAIATEEKDESGGQAAISGEATAIPEDSSELAKAGPAIWRNRDYDQPVQVIGDFGVGADGRRYARIAESSTAIPTDELVYPKNDWGEV